MSHIYYHLDRAIAVMRAEPNYRKWGPLIDAIEDKSAREACRAWLREEARKRQMFERMNEVNVARKSARG
jgi:hypothetical protein